MLDIWHGTILSQDGGLQLLYIVDYICDWARNVYRPKIRECLAGGMREITPSSTCPYSRSQSVLTQATETTQAVPQYERTVEGEASLPTERKTFRFLSTSEASSHPFSRWSADSHQRHTWTARATVRHSDLVNCSFRVFEIPEDAAAIFSLQSSMEEDRDGSQTMLLLLDLMQSKRYTIWLTRRTIDRLENCWTGAAKNPTQRTNAEYPDQRVGTFIFFRTFCNPEDWQINREICCIIWSLEAARLMSAIARPVGMTVFDREPWVSSNPVEFNETFPPFQSLCGRASVAYALGNATFSLSSKAGPMGVRQLQWELPSAHGVTEAVIAHLLSLMNSPATRQAEFHSENRQSSKLLEVLRNQSSTEIPSSFPHVPDDMGRGGAVLAVRPDSWPTTCPRLCLFVLVESCFNQREEFGQFLSAAVNEREIYGVDGPTAAGPASFLSREDRLLMKRWRASLSRDSGIGHGRSQAQSSLT